MSDTRENHIRAMYQKLKSREYKLKITMKNKDIVLGWRMNMKRFHFDISYAGMVASRNKFKGKSNMMNNIF